MPDNSSCNNPRSKWIVITNCTDSSLIGSTAQVMCMNHRNDFIVRIWSKRLNSPEQRVIVKLNSMKIFECFAEAIDFSLRFKALR